MSTTPGEIPLNLTRGFFRRRWKRFLSEVELENGELVTAHCANSGSMATLLTEGMEAWVRHDPKRKLAYTLVLLATPHDGLAVVDTQLPNKIVYEAIMAERIPELAGYANCKREVKYGSRNSRIDILLTDPNQADCFVEVKNDTMWSDSVAARADFPDAKTERGAKHLAELGDEAQAGNRAVQLYVVNRSDCTHAGIASERDPNYARAVRTAADAGVEFLAYRTSISPTGIAIAKRCDFTFP